jgi:hypothetical protein
MGKLQGKVAVISGGTTGIGSCCSVVTQSPRPSPAKRGTPSGWARTNKLPLLCARPIDRVSDRVASQKAAY